LIKIGWAKQPFQIGMDKGRRVIVYALIYDTHDPAKREKKVISLHKTRATAERALAKRMRKLGKRVWDCDTRNGRRTCEQGAEKDRILLAAGDVTEKKVENGRQKRSILFVLPPAY
jgi:hypothetical protein